LKGLNKLDITGFPGGFNNILNNQINFMNDTAILCSITLHLENDSKDFSEYYKDVLEILTYERKPNKVELSHIREAEKILFKEIYNNETP
jgi:hypothetical protein